MKNRRLWMTFILMLAVSGLILMLCSCKDNKTADSKVEVSTPEQETEAQNDELENETVETVAPDPQAYISREEFMNQDVYFAFDSTVITPEAENVLTLKAEWLGVNPDENIIIEGHCDKRGTNEYNLALGENRAQTVKSFLKSLGIADDRIETVSYGEEKPAVLGHNEAAWAKNRRVHLTIK